MSTCLTLCIVLLSPAAPAPAAAEPVPNPALEQFWREALKNVTDDESFNEVASMLGRIGPEAADAIPALLDELHSDRPNRRQAACTALGMIHLKADVVLPELVRLFAQRDVLVRRAAYDAAARFGPEAAPLFANALDDPAANIRITAARALWKATHKTDKILPVLLAALKDKEAGTRSAAAWALGEMGPAAAAAVPALAEEMNDPRPLQRVLAAFNLWKVEGKPEHVIPVFNRALEERDQETMANVFDLLRMMGHAAQGTTPALLKICNEPDNFYHVTALYTLHEVGADPKVVLAAARRALGHPNPDVRGNAALLLSDLGPEARADLPAIRALLKDKDPVARCQGAVAVWKFEHDASVIAVLTEELTSPNELAQAAAVAGLARIGPEAKGAVPRLLKLLEKSKPSARRPLLDAIRQIDPEAVPRKGER